MLPTYHLRPCMFWTYWRSLVDFSQENPNPKYRISANSFRENYSFFGSHTNCGKSLGCVWIKVFKAYISSEVKTIFWQVNANLKTQILNVIYVAGTWQKAKKKELLSDRRPSSAQQPPV